MLNETKNFGVIANISDLGIECPNCCSSAGIRDTGTGNCVCSPGWTGLDCSVPNCTTDNGLFFCGTGSTRTMLPLLPGGSISSQVLSPNILWSDCSQA